MTYERINFGEVHPGELAHQHILDCLETNWITEGPKVKLFEEQWGELFNYKYNTAVSSGTDACIAACLALYGVGARTGDEIIVPALGFIATANAVRAAGFVPVFVDVKKETLNIDESQIEEKISNHTRAIFAVHTMGRPCELDIIKKIADKHKIYLIEDACEAHGAKFKGQYVGTYGQMATFSYYVAHLICCGEGGMVSTQLETFDQLLKSVKTHGRTVGSKEFNHKRMGLNLRMNDLEASIGLEGIENFSKTFTKRHHLMTRITQRLEKFKHIAWFSEEDEGNINCPHGFSITVKKSHNLEQLKYFLDKLNIEYKRNFGCIPTQHGAFNEYFAGTNHILGDFPNAEYIGNNGIHIGIHAYLSVQDVDRIVTAIRRGLE